MGGESVLCWAWTFLLDMDFSIIKNFKSGHYTDLSGHLLEQSKFQVSWRNHYKVTPQMSYSHHCDK